MIDQARRNARAYEKTRQANMATWSDHHLLVALTARFPVHLPAALRGMIINAIASKDATAFLRENLRPVVDRLGDIK